MLQSRLRGAIFGRRSRLGVNWGLSNRFLCQEQEVDQSAATQGTAPTQGYAPLPTGLPADPAIHSSDPPQGGDTDDALNATAAEEQVRTTADVPDLFASPKPPTSASPTIGHTEVGSPSEPNIQQRRKLSEQPSPSTDAEAHKAQKRAQEDDNKEYFKHHKASPLSELEFTDTRKPITQATDSPTSYYGGDPGVLVWKPEQLETAEDTLLRAVEIWNWNKMRGDPDSPHGRVLRELRGEYW